MDILDPESDSVRSCTYVEEADELQEIVQKVVATGGQSSGELLARFNTILVKYQEQGNLLDPHLEQIVGPLSGILRNYALKAEAQEDLEAEALRGTCQLLWTIVTVRGYKSAIKFFPHEARDLEPVACLLDWVHNQTAKTTVAWPGTALHTEQAVPRQGQWFEADGVLLLWLSQLILIPFDLRTVDSALDDTASAPQQSPLVAKISGLATEYLGSAGSGRTMAALLMARLLTRPDQAAGLKAFLTWALGSLQTQGAEGSFIVPGVAHTLAIIFKIGHRNVLLPLVPKMWPAAAQLLTGPEAGRSSLVRKLAVKLAQRLALTTLARQGDAAAEEDTRDVGEEVEEAVGLLLTGLQDKDTVVRWSAAKGVGRLCSCLPSDMADEVVSSLLDLFMDATADAAWHGGCLALAELARRGLLLPSRLPTLSPLICKGLQFDVRRGPHSVGSHVRDAAAYVCWAFARAYSSEAMQASLSALAPSLLVTACYDREVNCRRAASAAFQESVGRQGGVFPHGINILTAADYFTLGTRNQAYLTVAPFVAQYPEYRRQMAEHLLQAKLQHWDKALRETAAQALAALVPTEPALFEGHFVDALLPLCLHPTLEVRHGATLGLAEVIVALDKAGNGLQEARAAEVAGVVPAIEKARLYRGKGGEIMRSAVCRLVECTALANLPLTMAQKKALHGALDDNLKHPNAAIQSQAAVALSAFCRAYIKKASPEALTRTTIKHLVGLKNENVAVRRGSALALGALPSLLLLPYAAEVLLSLGCSAQKEEDAEDPDAESRMNAVKALATSARELYGPTEAATEAPTEAAEPADVPAQLRQAVHAAIRALDDYSIDNRGDVGSWVREAAMASLPPLLTLMADRCSDMATSTSSAASPHSPTTSKAISTDTSLLSQHSHDENSLAEANGCSLNPVADGNSYPPKSITPSTADTLDKSKVSSANKAAGPEANGDSDISPPASATAAEEAASDKAPSQPCSKSAEQLMAAAIQGIVRQSVERIVRTREAALSSLRKLLQAQPPLPCVPARNVLDAVVLSAEPEHLATLTGLPALVSLIHVDVFRQPLLEGMAASIGGLDGSLGAAVSGALVKECQPSPSSGGGGLLRQTAEALLAIWPKHHDSSRMSTPLLRTLKAILVPSNLAELESHHPNILDAMLAAVEGELAGCKDVARQMAGADAFALLLACRQPRQEHALRSLLGLIRGRFPRVRRHAAEQLYVQLLSWEDGGARSFSEAENETAMSLLSEMAWEGPLDGVRKQCSAVAGALHVQLPALKTKDRPEAAAVTAEASKS